MGIRSMLRKVFGRDRAERNEPAAREAAAAPAPSVPPQTPREETTPAPAPTAAAGDPVRSPVERAAEDLVAAAFDNPAPRRDKPVIPSQQETEREVPAPSRGGQAFRGAERVGTTPETAAVVEPPTPETPKAEEPEAPVAEAPEKAEDPVVADEPVVTETPAPEPEPAKAEEPVAAEDPVVAEAPEPEPQPEPEAATPDPEPEAEAPEPEAEAPEPEPEPQPEPEAATPAPEPEAEPPVATDTPTAPPAKPATPATPLAALKRTAPLLADPYKAATAALKKYGLTGARATVYLVLDRSGSMRPYFKDGSAQRLGEQALALAAHLGEDPVVQVVFFSTEVDGTGELALDAVEGRIDELHASLGRMGRTNYHLAIEAVLAQREKQDDRGPALVLFQTDGAPESRTAAAQALAAAADEPVFWQFVTFGDPDSKAFDFVNRLAQESPNAGVTHAGTAPADTAHPAFFRALLADWRP
ncbi:VWA domain-containing protein [Streptomyces sp. NPDC001941]|uniref:VWA domain-containing protein n=1 Tax=Streptomyces sp. NPDC001941 TaxID=3154659 RepID=UPI00331EF972